MKLGVFLRVTAGCGIAASLTVAWLTSGCGSDKAAAPTGAQVLDPTQSHYGQTDDQWGALWWKWIYELPQTAGNCVVPIHDPTGKNCAVGQSQAVFFLAGTDTGVTVRDQCVVPAGKPIFFPILNFSADNGGVPPAMQLDDAGLIAAVQAQMDMVSLPTLAAEFDGVSIPNLKNYKTQTTYFTYTLPPEPNVYTCNGATGVTGPIDPAFAAGYYVMIAPPPPGAHTLHFKGSSPASAPPLTVEVTYHLIIK